MRRAPKSILRDRRGVGYGLLFTLIAFIALGLLATPISLKIHAGKRAALQVLGTPIIQGGAVYVTVRNVGEAEAMVTHLAYKDRTAAATPLAGFNPVKPEASTTFYAEFPPETFKNNGSTRVLTLITDKGELSFTAYAAR